MNNECGESVPFNGQQVECTLPRFHPCDHGATVHDPAGNPLCRLRWPRVMPPNRAERRAKR